MLVPAIGRNTYMFVLPPVDKGPPARQRAWASLLTLLPRLPTFARGYFAARPGFFAFCGGLPLRALARALGGQKLDFHTRRA